LVALAARRCGHNNEPVRASGGPIVVQCKLRVATVAAALIPSFACAETATRVFEVASPSVVTVHVHDALGRPGGQGSGVVWSAGEVATNCHVLKDGARYVVRHRGRDYPATLKQADWERDVCSLSVPQLAAPAVRLGNTRDLKVGQKVYAIGAPRGLELTLSEGIVSALREVTDGRYLQITAPAMRSGATPSSIPVG
jgi:S1-C subfamily serine protease